MDKIKQPVLCELVLLFQDQHMVCLIDTPKVIEIGNVIEDAWKKSILDKADQLIMINSVSGKCVFRVGCLFGFYFRAASKTAQEEFQAHVLKLTERQVEAVEKMVKGDVPGEEWKGS